MLVGAAARPVLLKKLTDGTPLSMLQDEHSLKQSESHHDVLRLLDSIEVPRLNVHDALIIKLSSQIEDALPTLPLEKKVALFWEMRKYIHVLELQPLVLKVLGSIEEIPKPILRLIHKDERLLAIAPDSVKLQLREGIPEYFKRILRDRCLPFVESSLAFSEHDVFARSAGFPLEKLATAERFSAVSELIGSSELLLGYALSLMNDEYLSSLNPQWCTLLAWISWEKSGIVQDSAYTRFVRRVNRALDGPLLTDSAAKVLCQCFGWETSVKADIPSEVLTTKEIRAIDKVMLKHQHKSRYHVSCVKGNLFAKPVDAGKFPTYRDKIASPMDIHTLRELIDLGNMTLLNILDKVSLIKVNCCEFSPNSAEICAVANGFYTAVVKDIQKAVKKVSPERWTAAHDTFLPLPERASSRKRGAASDEALRPKAKKPRIESDLILHSVEMRLACLVLRSPPVRRQILRSLVAAILDGQSVEESANAIHLMKLHALSMHAETVVKEKVWRRCADFHLRQAFTGKPSYDPELKAALQLEKLRSDGLFEGSVKWERADCPLLLQMCLTAGLMLLKKTHSFSFIETVCLERSDGAAGDPLLHEGFLWSLGQMVEELSGSDRETLVEDILVGHAHLPLVFEALLMTLHRGWELKIWNSGEIALYVMKGWVFCCCEGVEEDKKEIDDQVGEEVQSAVDAGEEPKKAINSAWLKVVTWKSWALTFSQKFERVIAAIQGKWSSEPFQGVVQSFSPLFSALPKLQKIFSFLPGE